jgi:hypothetical protein
MSRPTGAVLLVLVLTAPGCSRAPAAPTTRLDGAYRIVENLTGQVTALVVAALALFWYLLRRR